MRTSASLGLPLAVSLMLPVLLAEGFEGSSPLPGVVDGQQEHIAKRVEAAVESPPKLFLADVMKGLGQYGIQREVTLFSVEPRDDGTLLLIFEFEDGKSCQEDELKSPRGTESGCALGEFLGLVKVNTDQTVEYVLQTSFLRNFNDRTDSGKWGSLVVIDGATIPFDKIVTIPPGEKLLAVYRKWVGDRYVHRLKAFIAESERGQVAYRRDLEEVLKELEIRQLEIKQLEIKEEEIKEEFEKKKEEEIKWSDSDDDLKNNIKFLKRVAIGTVLLTLLFLGWGVKQVLVERKRDKMDAKACWDRSEIVGK